MLIEACLNGARTDAEHPAVPRSPTALALAAQACVGAGAGVLHLHPCNPDGRQTFAAEPCALAIQAVRAACPGVPISLSTSKEIEPDPARRLALISAWTQLPELVTANQGEAGIVELSEHLLARGVGIEAGLPELSDAHAFAAGGLAGRCARVLLEPLDADPETAVAHATAMGRVIADAQITLPQVHHGEGVATWAVMRRAFSLRCGSRAGLEDSVALPDGTRAADNAELVRAAVAVARAQSARP